MTLGKLLMIITILAVVFTGIVVFGLKKQKKIGMTFLQSFCGILFIISGWVKIIDPMGTGFKMQQYFAEFDAALEPTWMAFINGLWPILDRHIFTFSMAMIVLEIVLGIALLLGSAPKWVARSFFLLVVVFTILTGFTFLTGYVPTDTTFFDFSRWGEFVKTNMRVTDCGCFGDFMKLDPRTSFFKDVFLLVPSIIFLGFHNHFHKLLKSSWRSIILVISTVGLVLFGMSNYVWDIPDTDFRPFKEGVNIAKQKEAELSAQANVEVLAYRLKNLEENTIVEIPYNQYLSNYSSVYADKTKWETLEQILSEPTMEATKISEFAILSDEGYDISEELLAHPGYQFLIVSYKLKGEAQYNQVMVQDTIYRIDTIIGADTTVVEVIDRIEEKKVMQTNFNWDKKFLQKYNTKIETMAIEAAQDNIRTIAVAGAAGIDQRTSFKQAAGVSFDIYEADDILLKTIVRSNPGILLLKEGVIIKKWHYNQLPNFQEIKNKVL